MLLKNVKKKERRNNIYRFSKSQKYTYSWKTAKKTCAVSINWNLNLLNGLQSYTSWYTNSNILPQPPSKPNHPHPHHTYTKMKQEKRIEENKKKNNKTIHLQEWCTKWHSIFGIKQAIENTLKPVLFWEICAYQQPPLHP